MAASSPGFRSLAFRLLQPLRLLGALALTLALAWSFWASPAWLRLCAGLALFLFGMQCLEDGLRSLAGSRLEQLIGRGTDTPRKGLAFGIGATMVLQSSTLVSLLTIAFVSTGLLSLAGALPILFGANLGATSGIWLLAMAGQSFSLAPAALPLLVIGVVGGFFGSTAKAAGRVLLGVAFIFLGIDWLKQGFDAIDDSLDLAGLSVGGLSGQALFTGIGVAMTLVLQSSHAALMLTLAALAGGQIDLPQGLAIAIGSNVGSSVSTAVVGLLGASRGGQRLALAHVLFNGVTAALASLLLGPLAWLVRMAFVPFGLDGNAFVQLALFHTLFNAMGVALFWPWQRRLAAVLIRWLPDRQEPAVLTAPQTTRARYLNAAALATPATASMAIARELLHLERLSLEVIVQALFIRPDALQQTLDDATRQQAPPPPDAADADRLYQQHVKGIYSDLLAFLARLESPADPEQQQLWADCNLAALKLVEAVKDAAQLQTNLGHHLRGGESAAREAYVALRRELLQMLAEIQRGEIPRDDPGRPGWRADAFDTAFRGRLLTLLQHGELDPLAFSSLINDLGFATGIVRSLRNVLALAQNHALLRTLWRQADEANPPSA